MNPGSAGPRFAVSSRSTPLMGADDLLRVAHGAAVDGVDLDFGGSSLRRRLTSLERQEFLDHGGVTSAWVPAASTAFDDLLGRTLVRRGSLAIVDEEKGSTPNGRVQLATAIRLRHLIPDEARIALAVRPRNPEAGRAHLARLSLLRNVAEEWDLDLALDMSGPVDWLWEAEAAVFRLAPRLRLLRIIYPLPTLDAQTRSRLTQRTIAACVDAGFEGVIAVVCPMPFWRWRSLSALERSMSTAVERLSGRFGIFPVRPFHNLPQRSSTP
jgi:hypothetical protein